MCGIIGEISHSSVDIPTFEAMRDELSHRGPDGADTYVNDDGTVALGFRRLAIIDLSDAGMQPMANEDETTYLLFNGEIYNFRSLRSELEGVGHEFSSETDSEVILHGYEEWGTDVVTRLRGMFAFAIWDEDAEQLFAARDPFGIKPFYYYCSDGRFVFASELKGILADESIPRSVSCTGLQSYLKYGYVPAPLTIWEDTSKLIPGQYLLYDGSTVEVESYWDPSSYREDRSPGIETAADQLASELRDSVKSHLVSDVPVGVLLSGGVDSSTIAALASESNRDLSAFSMGFEGLPDELEYSRRVADLFDLDYGEEVMSTDHFETLLDDVLYAYDEPLADTSIFPTFLLMRAVSDQFKVALAGDGGDELFAGYRWYDKYLFYKRLRGLAPLFSVAHSLLQMAHARFPHSLVQSAEWRADLASRESMSQYLASMHFSFSDGELGRILQGKFATNTDVEPLERYAVGWDSVKDLQCFDLRTLLPSILTKVDRASMANSLEVRVPLLDRDVAEFSLSLADEYHYRDTEKKFLLRQVARSLLPDDIVDRSKSGFGAPLDEMSFVGNYVDVIQDSRAASDGIFDQTELDAYIETHPRHYNLFKLIMFELWYRRWVS